MNRLDAFIKHAISSERYGNNTKEKVLRRLHLLYNEIETIIKNTTFISTKTNYERVLKEIKACINEYQESTTDILLEAQSFITSTESEWLKTTLSDLGKIVIPATLLASVRFSPVSNAVNTEEMVRQSAYKINTQMDIALRSVYITQNDPAQIISTINNSKRIMEKQIENEVITHNDTVFRVTDYLMYRANKTKVTYCSILDDRTCIECGEFNGKTFDSDKAPVLPLHNRCRCILVPSAFIDNESVTSYSDWIESLNEKEKLNALGKTRYQLYKSGIPVTSFVNDGSLISVKELKDTFDEYF